MRKITEVIVRGSHLRVKEDCEHCPEGGHVVVAPKELKGPELKNLISRKYPGAKITMDRD